MSDTAPLWHTEFPVRDNSISHAERCAQYVVIVSFDGDCHAYDASDLEFARLIASSAVQADGVTLVEIAKALEVWVRPDLIDVRLSPPSS